MKRPAGNAIAHIFPKAFHLTHSKLSIPWFKNTKKTQSKTPPLTDSSQAVNHGI